jgi:hypothetical protein
VFELCLLLLFELCLLFDYVCDVYDVCGLNNLIIARVDELELYVWCVNVSCGHMSVQVVLHVPYSFLGFTTKLFAFF